MLHIFFWGGGDLDRAGGCALNLIEVRFGIEDSVSRLGLALMIGSARGGFQ